MAQRRYSDTPYRRMPATDRLPARLHLVDDAVFSATGDVRHARALQRRLSHTFDRGVPERRPEPRYSGASRLVLLLGATASGWYGIYIVSQILFG